MPHNRVFHNGNVYWGGWFHPGMRVHWQGLELVIASAWDLKDGVIPEGEVALLVGVDSCVLDYVIQILRYRNTVVDVVETTDYDMALLVPMDSVTRHPPGPVRHRWAGDVLSGSTVRWRSHKGFVLTPAAAKERRLEVPSGIVPIVLIEPMSIREFHGRYAGTPLAIEARVVTRSALLLLVPRDELIVLEIPQPA